MSFEIRKSDSFHMFGPSPDVSPELITTLTLGSPPEALRNRSHPLATLFRTRWELYGSDILIPAENDLAHFGVFSGVDQTS
jgi:hypothetical protein